jgi:N-dimethylarginine dimethylaminohydrolase
MTTTAPTAVAQATPWFLASALFCTKQDGVMACTKDDRCSYRVAWSINPHMRIGSAHVGRALWQHCNFIRCLETAGGVVTHLPFVHGAYDSVFAKDNAVLCVRRGVPEALLGTFLHDQRRAEQAARSRSLARAGFRVRAAAPAALEGGDVVQRPAGGAFLGHGFRSSVRAIATLERFLEAPVIPLRLRDPRLFHLDMALNILNCGTTLVCEEALDARSVRELRRATTGDIVRISRKAALGFGVNAVEVHGTVIMGAEHEEVRRALEARGKRVVVTPLDEFHHAGGSAACLVARLHT